MEAFAKVVSFGIVDIELFVMFAFL